MAQCGPGAWSASRAEPAGGAIGATDFSSTIGAATTFLPKAILDSIEKQSMNRLKMPKNFMIYAFSLPLHLSEKQINDIQELLQQWARWDIFESLANYHSVVKTLFRILKETRMQTRGSHIVAREMFENLSRDLHVLHDRLVFVLRNLETYVKFLALRGALAQQLLDLLQELLDSFPASLERSRLSKALMRLSRASGLHPTCFPLTGLQKVGKQVAAGAFSDIWKGLVRGQSVSVKMVRLFQDPEVKAAVQEFGREALIWRQLSHPNLLPFFGLYYLDARICLVSPWMTNGHVLQFLENAPADTDRVSLMLDVAMGLRYLHGEHVVHGDLKGMNILVTPSHRACVADFGLSSIVDAMTLRFTHSSGRARGTARYLAPELLMGEMQNHYGSDVYAFAIVCYEILTGKAPFHELAMNDMAVGLKVIKGSRPSRPEAVPSNGLWKLLEDCWDQEPTKRPKVVEITQRLVGPAIGAKVMGAATDWDETFSSRCRRSLQEWPLTPSVAAIERRIFGDDVVEACPECFPELQEPVSPDNEDSRRHGSMSLSPSLNLGSPSLRESHWQPSGILSPISDCDFDNEETFPSRNGWQSTLIPISCLAANHYVPIQGDDRPPQMCRVFVSTHDLEIHHAAPQNLPPLPRLDLGSSETPRRSPTPIDHSSVYPWTPPNSQPELAQPVFDITSCNAYLTMLSQPPPEPAVADTAIVAQDNLYNAAVRDILQYNRESPLFKFDDDAFLTSPIMEPPLSCFGTSSTDTPFSDFLSTPDLVGDALFPPLLGERDESGPQLSLFGGYDVSLPDISPKSAASVSGPDVVDSSPPLFDHFFPTPPSSQTSLKAGLEPELQRQQRREASWKRTISNTSTRESSPSRSIKRRRMDIESLLDSR